jgi:uncharacterized protein (DUF2252 family)
VTRHLSNFGVFASPQRQLVFDINDFDETLPGPWEWDVKRLAVSTPRGTTAIATRTRSGVVLNTRWAVRRGDARVRRNGQPRGVVRAPEDLVLARKRAAQFKPAIIKRT